MGSYRIYWDIMGYIHIYIYTYYIYIQYNIYIYTMCICTMYIYIYTVCIYTIYILYIYILYIYIIYTLYIYIIYIYICIINMQCRFVFRIAPSNFGHFLGWVGHCTSSFSSRRLLVLSTTSAHGSTGPRNLGHESRHGCKKRKFNILNNDNGNL